MKKLLEAIKANKTLLIVLALIFVLIAIVVIFYQGGDEDTVGASADKSATEVRLEVILSSIEGVGDSRAYVTEDEDGIEGVVVVCDGGSSIMVRNDIINAVSTALGINKNIIAVYAMN